MDSISRGVRASLAWAINTGDVNAHTRTKKYVDLLFLTLRFHLL